MDIWINDNARPLEGGFKEVLQSAAPPGLVIASIVEVDDRAPALQTLVVSAEYEVTLLDPVAGQVLEANISRLLEAASLPRERRGKPYDLRPLIVFSFPPAGRYRWESPPAHVPGCPPGRHRSSRRGPGCPRDRGWDGTHRAHLPGYLTAISQPGMGCDRPLKVVRRKLWA